jgi:hypothetical protein
MARRVNAGAAATLLVCALFACAPSSTSDGDEHDDNNFRADVIECEDALERLERCCPGFDAAPVLCNFYHSKTSGCGSVATDNTTPAFSRDESKCIRDTSCDSLVATKVCERAQLARAYESHKQTSLTSSDTEQWKPPPSSTTDAPPTAPRPVCP